jgi:hypothetical protein
MVTNVGVRRRIAPTSRGRPLLPYAASDGCRGGWLAAAPSVRLRPARGQPARREPDRRQHEKAFAQSERARVEGLCKVSPPVVLVRHQPFIGPVGQGCRMGCQLHVNFEGPLCDVISRAGGGAAVFHPAQHQHSRGAS